MFERFRFQFSIRRMLCAVAWFCAAAGLFTGAVAHTNDSDGLVPFTSFLLCLSSAGGGIGAMAGNARKGAIISFFCFFFAFFVLFGLMMLVPVLINT